jgi:hypothetical protein
MKNKILLFLLVSSSLFGQVKINEIMASNTSTIQDNNGIYSDWFELYNPSGTPIDLSNFYVTDLKSNLTKFRFTSLSGQVVLPANGYLIIWASDNVAGGYHHTNFSLSSTFGETLYMVAPDGTSILDSLKFLPQRDNVSFGRLNDGGSTLKYFFPASPATTNNASNAYEGFLDPPVFSRNGGFFSSNFTLNISHPEPLVSIYYTLDGSEPDPNNLGGKVYNYKNSYPEHPGDPFGSFSSRSYSTIAYNLPINIQDKTNEPNQISNISSTWHLNPTYLPSFNIKKGTVIRAVAVKTGFLASEIKTGTFIYSPTGSNPYSFPVVSVAMQENHLFEYNQGIYTAGVTFDNYRIQNPLTMVDLCTPGNYMNDGDLWERPGNMELVETQQNIVNQPLDIRIHGSCSTNAQYKSLRFYSSNEFDKYAFFPNYPSLLSDRILLRNSGNDYNQTMFKDAFIHNWLGYLNFSSQKSRPAIMFLNGEYWGIHNIRERIDRYYLNALYGVNQNNLDLRKIIWNEPAEVEEGDSVHYTNMYNFITTNDMAITANFDQVKQMLDPVSLIDYQLAEIFIGNIDWPQNNVRLWRTRNPYDPTAPPTKDGRWRWIFYDTDRALGEVVNAQNGDLETLINKIENIIFKKLLDNPEFRTNFINRYADLLNSSLKSTHSLPIFNTFKNTYSPEVSYHINRWKNLPNLAAWEAQCAIVSTYLTIRPNEIPIQLKNFFNLTGEYNLTVSTHDTLKGYVRVNTLPIINTSKGIPNNYQTWTGSYFDNLPIKITAIPKSGFKFSYWLYNGTHLTDSTISIITSNDVTYQAFFEPAILSNNPIPSTAAEIAKCGYKITEWDASQAAGGSPANSKFVFLDTENPLITAQIEGYTSGVFNFSSKTRINGLGANGFSFINTSDANVGYPGNKLGGFLLAINTMNLDTIKLTWTGRTITANPRKYNIRLYFRIGDVQPFQDFNPVIQYNGNITSGHSQTFRDIILPEEIMNQPYVQLFWKYYYTGSAASSARDQLGIDDILIKGVKVLSGNITSGLDPSLTPNHIYGKGQITNGNNVNTKASDAITLLPGFEAKTGSTFKAEIKTCN